MNRQIRNQDVLLVLESGGTQNVPVRQALRVAEEAGLDLVEVSFSNGISTCKIMDYGKYQYEQRQREKKNRQSHSTVNKEMKFGVNIEPHDLKVKVNKIEKLISSGANVKITIRLRGREMSHPERAVNIINKVTEATADFAKVSTPIKTEGNTISLGLAKK